MIKCWAIHYAKNNVFSRNSFVNLKEATNLFTFSKEVHFFYSNCIAAYDELVKKQGWQKGENVCCSVSLFTKWSINLSQYIFVANFAKSLYAYHSMFPSFWVSRFKKMFEVMIVRMTKLSFPFNYTLWKPLHSEFYIQNLWYFYHDIYSSDFSLKKVYVLFWQLNIFFLLGVWWTYIKKER